MASSDLAEAGLFASGQLWVFIDDIIVLVSQAAFAAWYRIIWHQLSLYSLECQPIKSKAFVPCLPELHVCPAIVETRIPQVWSQLELLGSRVQIAIPIGLCIEHTPPSTIQRVVSASSVCAHLAAMLNIVSGRQAVKPVVCNLLRNVNLAMSYDVHVLPKSAMLAEVDAFDDLVSDVVRRLICEPGMSAVDLEFTRLHVARGGLGLISLADRATGGFLFSTIRILPMLVRRSASLSSDQQQVAWQWRLKHADV